MNEELKTRLTELGFSEEQTGKLADQGVAGDAEMVLLNEYEIREITGCTVIAAKKAAKAFAPAPPAAEQVTAEPASLDTLPTVPDDSSFLEMLKVGGMLKVERIDVMSAMRAAIAARVGLYELPEVLLARAEQFADEQEEPAGENFKKVYQLAQQRRYGDVLSALGYPGNFMSDKRKSAFLARLNTELWPALRSFNELLINWTDTWAKGVNNPMMALSVLAMAQTGRGGAAVMPPGMLQPPDTAGLRDEAEAVINRINKVFGGLGIPVARALAHDATRIKGILEDPALPATVGATTRDMMLKMLGVNVGADYVRLERNITRYALGIMELSNVATGNEEYGYLGALLQLGGAIPWDKLDQEQDSNRKQAASRPPRRDPALVRGDNWNAPALDR
ncbi:hypothetical protein HYW46_03685 [Candidatus Daviesbacteria bacterium]|nr:hypothetical protein [Candidatus Daviesbacteria bacterium]